MNTGRAVALRTVTHSFAFLLCLGALLNTVSKYEWAIFRSVDLYSWAPASEATYRYFWANVNFLINVSHFENGINVQDVDGMQIFRDNNGRDLKALQQRTNEFLRDYQAQKSQRNNSTSSFQDDVDSSNFQIQALIVVYYVDNDTASTSWYDYCFGTNQPRVRQQLFADWENVYEQIPSEFFRLITLDDFSYLQSKTYWLLIAIPILALVYDIRLPLTNSALSSRQALFRSFPWLILWGKRYLLDPLSVLYCLLNAAQYYRRHYHHDYQQMSFGLTLLDLLAYAYSANAKESYRISALISFGITMVIRCFTVVAQTMTVYQFEKAKNVRVFSTTDILFPQLVAATVLSQLYIRFCSSNGGTQQQQQQQQQPQQPSMRDSTGKDDQAAGRGTGTKAAEPTKESKMPGAIAGRNNIRNPFALRQRKQDIVTLADIETGLCKYVFSMHFYTAASTKLGQTGLGWIDDRYLVQLALRGRYEDGQPFPLEFFMIWMPPLFRALGMVTVLMMQLSAITSWWKFGHHAALWITFIIVSTISIGVPLRVELLGPLLQNSAMDIVREALWKYHHHWVTQFLVLLLLVVSGFRLVKKARQPPKSD